MLQVDNANINTLSKIGGTGSSYVYLLLLARDVATKHYNVYLSNIVHVAG